MGETKHMSRYAAKKARQAEERLALERHVNHALAAIDLAVRITEGTAKPPSAKNPKQPPPEPRGRKNDLGGMPAACADELAAAGQHLRRANELASAMLAAAAKGLQTAEPRALEAMTLVMAAKVENAAERARKIPNKGVC